MAEEVVKKVEDFKISGGLLYKMMGTATEKSKRKCKLDGMYVET